MTESDRKMMEAVRDGRPFEYNDRSVRPEGNRMVISLHGRRCASVDFGRGFVTVHGEALRSRKSAKVFNAVLRTYTEAYARSTHGRWDVMVPIGTEVEFSDERLSIPISKGYDRRQSCILPELPVMISTISLEN